MTRRVLGAALVALTVLVTPAAADTPWQPLPGLNASSGAQWIRAFAYDLSTNAIFAGTEGEGIKRSQTLGASWSDFSGGLPNDVSPRRVRGLAIVGTTTYAGSEAGVFKSTGGSNWQPAGQGDQPDPAHPTKLNESVETLYASGTTLLAGTFNAGVWKSTDGGGTWKPPAAGNGMPLNETVDGLTAHPVTPGVIFAAAGSGAYRSANFGDSWQRISDGLPSGTSPIKIWVDTANPAVLYAGTGSAGVYRSINAGTTWQPINDGFGGTRVRGLEIFVGQNDTHLYAADEITGLWAGRVPHTPINAAPSWRKVTDAGLNGHVNMWSLTAPVINGTGLIAGTGSDGGFLLPFAPPTTTCPAVDDDKDQASNSTACPKVTGTPSEGTVLTASTGTWAGTETIDKDFQWQRKPSGGAWGDIAGATDSSYAVTSGDKAAQASLRVKVTAINDYPQADPIHRFSKGTANASANPNAFPGSDGLQSPQIGRPDGTPVNSPAVGETLTVPNGTLPSDPPKISDGWFRPAATTKSWQWLRCTGTLIASCDEIDGADKRDYKLQTADGEATVRVRLTGVNESGTKILTSADTNEVIAEPATNVTPPTLLGKAYVGESLIGSVGEWKDPQTVYERRWLRCDVNGCSPIQELESGDPEHSSSYTVREGDKGYKLIMRVIADARGDVNHLKAPDAVELDTAQSAEVIDRPASDPPPGVPAPTPPPDPGGPGAPGATPTPTPVPISPVPLDKLAPALTKAKVSNQKLSLTLSEAGTVRVSLVRILGTGRLKGKKCVKPTRALRKKKQCERTKSAGTVTKKGALKGSVAIALPKKLAKGSYRATITATDGAGNRSRALTVKFKVTR